MNEDKCRFECREELIDKVSYDKGSVFNSSNCGYECDRSCDIGEYLDYKNCKCRKKIAGALVEECSKNIDGNKMIYNGTVNTIPSIAIKKMCGSCKLDTVLFAVFLVTSTVISTVFIYFYWYSKKNISNAYY